MPSWGRPSWGRNGGSSSSNSRRRKEWERQQREWESENTGRFEELDSDFSDDQNTDLRPEYEVSEPSDFDDDDYDDRDEMQLAMRDKEETLVARAMARIRRAQELGRDNVKLTPAESEALERKMAKDRAKGRKPIVERIPPKKLSRQSLPAPTSRKKASRASLSQEEHYNDRPRLRTSSVQNLQQRPPQQRRALPEDPNWRPRSSSSAQQPPYPLSPQEMQMQGYAYPYPQLPPANYRPNQRHVSGPAELTYPSIPPYPTGPAPHRSAYASSSDPALNRRNVSGSSTASRRRDFETSDDDDEDSEDDDAGVNIDVVPSSSAAQGYEVVQRVSPSLAQHQFQQNTGRAPQSASLGRRRGGAVMRR